MLMCEEFHSHTKLDLLARAGLTRGRNIGFVTPGTSELGAWKHDTVTP